MTEEDETLIRSAKPDNREMLVGKIIELLNKNPDRLMSILYRIDVSEKKVKEIFANAIPPDVPDLLADLIIERQLAKARTQEAARSSKEDPS